MTERDTEMHTLVTGWFSFEDCGATAGDLHARDVVCRWLERAGSTHDVAVAAPFTDGVDWRAVDPTRYTHLLFVCGPFGENWLVSELLARFAHCAKVGVNLSMLQRLDDFQPFDLLLERDSEAQVRPDIAFLSRRPLVPLAGLILVHPQKEYGDRGRHGQANKALRAVLDTREAAVVPVDTRLDHNTTGQRTAAEIEAMIARTDVVLTTRLHGTVLALKNGVPPLVIDPIAGGAKIVKQVRALGWPVLFDGDRLDHDELLAAYDWCLTDEARSKACEVAAGARARLAAVRDEFLRGFPRAAGSPQVRVGDA